MAREPVELNVTAKDDASKTLDKIAAKGEELNAEKVVIKVKAEDAEAQAVLGEDEARIAALEAEPAVINVVAEDAEAEAVFTADEARVAELDGTPAVIQVTAEDAEAQAVFAEDMAQVAELGATPAVIEVTAVDGAAPVLAADQALVDTLNGTPVVIQTAVVGTAAADMAALDAAAVSAAGSTSTLAAAETNLTGTTAAAGTALVGEVTAAEAVAAVTAPLAEVTDAAAAAQLRLGAAAEFVANVFGSAYVAAIEAGMTDTEAMTAAEGTLAEALATMTASLQANTAALGANAAASGAAGAAAEASKGKVKNYGDILTDAEKAAKGTGGWEGLIGSLGEASGALTGAVGAALPVVGAVAAAGFGVEKLATDFQNLALQASNFSTVTGTSLEDASKFIEVGNDLGVSVETIQGAIGRMNKNIGQGKIDLADYGVTATDATGRFTQLIEHLAGVSDETQQAAEGAAIFGKAWQTLAPIVSRAGELDDRFKSISKEKIITPDKVRAAQALQDAMDGLKDAIDDVKLALGGIVVGPLTDVLSIVGNVRNGFQEVSDTIHDIPALGDIFGGLGDLGAGGLFKPIVTGFKAVRDATDTSNGVLNAWRSGLGDVAGAVPVVGGVLQGLIGGQSAASKAAEEHNKKLADQKKNADAAAQAASHYNTTQAETAAAAAATTKEIQKGVEALQRQSKAWDHASESAGSFNSVFSQQASLAFDVHQNAADVIDDMGALGKAVTDAGGDFKATGGHLTTFTEDGRNVLDAVQKLSGAIGTDLTTELKNSGGNYDAVRVKASSYRDELVQQLTQLGLNSDSIQGYLEFLGLTPEQVETTIKLSQQDEARKKIADLHVDISNLPTEARTEFLADTNKGDYEAAYTLLFNTLTNNGKGVTTDAHANVEPGTQEMGTWRIGEEGKLIFAPATADTSQAQQVMGVWRVDETGQKVFVPVDANTSPAMGATSTWRLNEQGRPVLVSVDANTSAASAKIQSLLSLITSANNQIGNAFLVSGHGMAGTPYSREGVYRVGEAGPENVYLPRGSRVDTAGRTMMSSGGGGGTTVNYHITVNAPPLSSPADVGQAAVSAIKAYERRSGRGWRAA